MSYVTTSLYSGTTCASIAFQSAVIAIPDCAVVKTQPSYQNCTSTAIFPGAASTISFKMDCVSAASADSAFRKVNTLAGSDFVGVHSFNGTTCATVKTQDEYVFSVLNKCIDVGIASSKTTVDGNMVKVTTYVGNTCDGAATPYGNYTLGTCNVNEDGKTSSKAATYTANSGSASKVSWGLVFAVVVSQLL